MIIYYLAIYDIFPLSSVVLFHCMLVFSSVLLGYTHSRKPVSSPVYLLVTALLLRSHYVLFRSSTCFLPIHIDGSQSQ